MVELTEYATAEIDRFVDSFMACAECGRKVSGGDLFWEKSEKAFLTALIYYVLENDEISIHEKNFTTILRLIQIAKEDTPFFNEGMEAWFEKNAVESPYKAKLYYDTFLVAPSRTKINILYTIGEDLERYISSGAFYTAKSDGISWATGCDFIQKLSNLRELNKRQSVFSERISW